MTEPLLGVHGGLGQFLLGMAIMTDGLKSFAGDSLRNIGSTFTGWLVVQTGSGEGRHAVDFCRHACNL